MNTSKAALDNVNAAAEKVQGILNQVEKHLTAGENELALALQPQLDDAKLQYDKQNQLYLSILNASHVGPDPARPFMPAGGVQVTLDEGDQEFGSQSEFFKAVKDAALHPSREDPRLRSRKVVDVTGMSEGVPADGGYLLQPTVAGPIVDRIYSTGQILSRVATDPVGPNSNSAVYSGIDETTRASSLFGGIIGYWVAEGVAPTASKPKFREVDLKLKKVAALCYATDEQLEDTVNLAAWLSRNVPNALRFYAEDAIYEGDGVGKPLGIMNSPCLISIFRETVSKIAYADIVNMWARRWPGFQDYVWLINADTTPSLDQLVLASSTDMPTRFIDYGPDGVMRMKGRPVLEVEYAATAFATGDIMLASLSQYQVIRKGDVNEAVSIHVAFTTDESAFRFTMRIDGKPLWHSALTPLHGSNTQGPFVVLTAASS
jgi:HK97 family phage major capsid protein